MQCKIPCHVLVSRCAESIQHGKLTFAEDKKLQTAANNDAVVIIS